MLDPDPARYSSVDDGGEMVEAILEEAGAELASAPLLPGFRNLASTRMPTSLPAARPAVATSPDGTSLVAWIEWDERLGERVVAVTLDPSGRLVTEPQPVSGPPGDCLRPSVAFDGDGRGFTCFGIRRDRGVGVWCARQQKGGGFGPVELVSTTAHPSFNQELARHDDGALECCWQGYENGRFRIYSRRQVRGGFGETQLLSEDDERNVWDPTIAVDGNGQDLLRLDDLRRRRLRDHPPQPREGAPACAAEAERRFLLQPPPEPRLCRRRVALVRLRRGRARRPRRIRADPAPHPRRDGAAAADRPPARRTGGPGRSGAGDRRCR